MTLDPHAAARCAARIARFVFAFAAASPTLAQPSAGSTPPAGGAASLAGPANAYKLTSRVSGDLEDVWSSVFRAEGRAAFEGLPVVVHGSGARSGCGTIPRESPPTYCAADRRLYVSPTFLSALAERTGPGGDFAGAHLIARGFGEYVGEVRGIPAHAAAGPVADCFAGVWTSFAKRRGLAEVAEIEKGLPAALAAGDPAKAGAADARIQAFRVGLDTGDARRCEAAANPSRPAVRP